MRNPARSLTLISILGVMLWVAGCAKSERPIRIGFAGALTGSAAYLGTEIRRGAEIAIAEINAKGGVDGRKLELVSRDDEHEPVKTVAQYRELVEREGVVAMIGATNSASMLAVVPLVNDTLKVPVICPATDATAITENDSHKQGRDNYIYRVGMYGTGQANFMVDTAVKKLGYQRVGLLTWSGGWGTTGRGELLRRLSELGLRPVGDETFDDSDTDMTAQLIKLRDAGAEVILNYGLVRENSFVAATRRQIDMRIPYFSAWGVAGNAFVAAAGEAAEGILVSTTVTTDGAQSAERKAFIEQYRMRYKESMSAPVFALGSYDAVYLLKTAMEEGGVEPAQIRTALENIPSFDGLVHHFDRPVFTRERHNALTEDDMIVARWTGGKLLHIQFDAEGAYVEPEADKKVRLDKQALNPL